MTGANVLSLLQQQVPESDDVVAEHLTDHDELLLHLLMSDLLRLTVAAHASGDHGTTDRLLAFADTCLRDGDDYVRNAVSVSFVEGFGSAPGETDELLARWPEALRQELDR